MITKRVSRRDRTKGRRADAPERHSSNDGDGICVSQSVAINRSAEDLYNYWRNFQNLARFMEHLKSVQGSGVKRSHWVVKGPVGRQVQWDAEITEDLPGRLIAWRSLPGADVENAGAVRFERATGGRGTFVRVLFRYKPPGGRLGAAVARLSKQNPEKQVREDLRRFKQLMEAGETPTTEHQPHGP